MTAEKRQQHWRDGCGLVSGLSSWVMVAGGIAYLVGQPTLGTWLLIGGVGGVLAGIVLYTVPIR